MRLRQLITKFFKFLALNVRPKNRAYILSCSSPKLIDTSDPMVLLDIEEYLIKNNYYKCHKPSGSIQIQAIETNIYNNECITKSHNPDINGLRLGELYKGNIL